MVYDDELLKQEYLELKIVLGLSDARTEIRGYKLYIHLYSQKNRDYFKIFDKMYKDNVIQGDFSVEWQPKRKLYHCRVLLGGTLDDEVTWENKHIYMEKMVDFLNTLRMYVKTFNK